MSTNKFLICCMPINQFFTYGKKYEIIKSIHKSYLIKCDLGYVMKVSKERFMEEQDFKSFHESIENHKKLVLNIVDTWK